MNSLFPISRKDWRFFLHLNEIVLQRKWNNAPVLLDCRVVLMQLEEETESCTSHRKLLSVYDYTVCGGMQAENCTLKPKILSKLCGETLEDLTRAGKLLVTLGRSSFLETQGIISRLGNFKWFEQFNGKSQGPEKGSKLINRKFRRLKCEYFKCRRRIHGFWKN